MKGGLAPGKHNFPPGKKTGNGRHSLVSPGQTGNLTGIPGLV